MGRNCNIASLPVEQQAQVDECIRSHRYMNLDSIMEAIGEFGISGVSRSALHRYLGGLKEKDALHAHPEEGTIITIVERGTGEVRIVKTCASGLAIATMIEKIRMPHGVS